MTWLVDTHLLIWAVYATRRLSPDARRLLADRANRLAFSVASPWEIVIKAAKARADFAPRAAELRRALLGAGWAELPIRAEHVLELVNLPRLHTDPFDRILLAQARVEGMRLLTADRRLADYGAPVTCVA